MNTLRCEEPSWLVENLNKQTDSILVLDLRTREDFLTGHVRTSVNLPCQNSGEMERGTSVEQLLCPGSTAEERGRLAARGHSESIVLYDQDSTEERKGEALMAVADMLVAEKCRHVCFLNGGFTSILRSHKDIVSPAKKAKRGPRGPPPPLSLPGSKPGNSEEEAKKTADPDKEQVKQGQLSEVLPGVFLGDWTSAKSRDAMIKFGITDVFNVTSDLPNTFETDEELNITYDRYAAEDVASGSLTPHFERAFYSIDQILSRKGCVLVHCLAGKSRSPTIVLAYIMRTKKWGFDKAYDFVKERRRNIEPNMGFLSQLMKFEADMVSDGILLERQRSDADTGSSTVSKSTNNSVPTSSHETSAESPCPKTQATQS
ncbi:dual specificity protein phosphatase 7-like [Sycon ciliatum]|uniref:dual specificity protein phosphatase 7-like n=1 Tax=Sycon ciliatum TaxID=27933 RepID=UPI0031F60A85